MFRQQTKKAKRHVVFPNGYVWLVFVASLDIMLTWVILHLGGWERNNLADRIIYRFGLPGLVIYKFALLIVVISICEFVGQRKKETARQLLSVGIMLSAMPVVLALILIAIGGV